jgi:hypothetical protein
MELVTQLVYHILLMTTPLELLGLYQIINWLFHILRPIEVNIGFIFRLSDLPITSILQQILNETAIVTIP